MQTAATTAQTLNIAGKPRGWGLHARIGKGARMSDGCPYCQRSARNPEALLDEDQKPYVDILNNKKEAYLEILTFDDYDCEIPINYCPICGRKLGNE